MQITIRNNAQLPNKYLRFIKWKLYGLQEKFKHLSYAHVFLNTEGQSPKTYIANIRLGIPGHDLIIQNKSTDLVEVFRKSHTVARRSLTKNKEIRTANSK